MTDVYQQLLDLNEEPYRSEASAGRVEIKGTTKHLGINRLAPGCSDNKQDQDNPLFTMLALVAGDFLLEEMGLSWVNAQT